MCAPISESTVCVYTCLLVHVHSKSCLIPLPLCSWRQGPAIKPRAPQTACSEDFLSPLPLSWDCRFAHPHLAFRVSAGENSGPHICTTNTVPADVHSVKSLSFERCSFAIPHTLCQVGLFLWSCFLTGVPQDLSPAVFRCTRRGHRHYRWL